MNTESSSQSSSQSSSETGHAVAASRGWIWMALRWALFTTVIVFVGKKGYELWNEDQLQQVEISFIWLVPALGVYLLGGLPAVWFWRQLMRAFGGDVSFRDSVRAYYCGQLGKYIPGKATVLVIRSGMLKGRGLGVAASAITATCETLLMMGVGLAVAAALSPIIISPLGGGVGGTPTAPLQKHDLLSSLPNSLHNPFVEFTDWINSIPNGTFIVPFVVVIVCLASLPIIAFLLSRLAVKMTPAEMMLVKKEMRIPAKEIGYGLIAFSITWILFGLSLGLTIRAVSGGPMNFGDWPIWIGAVSAATAIGFLAIFAPGGFGVREGLLWMVLGLHIPEKQAVAAAVLLRLVWLVAEIAAAGVLYYIVRPSDNRGQCGVTDLNSDQKKG